MRALVDAEQELYFTRLQLAEFMGFPVSPDNVDETVQRIGGIREIDAKAIYDSMYVASGPLAMEEKRTAIEMMGIQEGMRRQNAILRWCYGEANLTNGLTKETAKTQLERFYRDGCVWSLVHDEEMVSVRKRRQQGKQQLDEEPTSPKRDLDKAWLEEWPTDDIHPDELILDESEYVRAFVTESLPELLESRQQLFWNL